MLFNFKNKIFIIAELGHNHQGNIENAFELIKQAKQCGADAVKLQKRDNKKLYTKAFYNSKYDHENSYGETYGKHRDFLEFDLVQYKELQAYAKDLKIDFFATPFDLPSIEFLEKINIPCYKIASADLTNTPLQTELAKLGKPLIQSTGGGTLLDVKRAVETISKFNKDLTILHCTTSYPSEIKDMNLAVIQTYKNEFKEYRIGLSDHENGIDAAPIAYMLGARTFEKHFTLNRANKGTDHAFSLEPQGLSKLVRNLHRIDEMIGSSEKKLLESEKKPLFKMKKSIVASKNLAEGHVLRFKDIAFKSPGGGLEPYRFNEVVGKKIISKVNEDEIITLDNLN